jgi:lanosterol synthase
MNSSGHRNYSSRLTLLRCSVSVHLKFCLSSMPIQALTGNIMTEFEYPECTTSVVTALAIFKKRYPTYRNQEIDGATAKAIKYLHDTQYPHGGWFGSWGICFTYATMFALESLSLVGETYHTSPAARKACEFLVSKQREDGGWGESYKVRSILR